MRRRLATLPCPWVYFTIATNLDVVRVQFQRLGGVSDGVAKSLKFDLGLKKEKVSISKTDTV